MRAWTVAGVILIGASAGHKEKLSTDTALGQQLEPFSPAKQFGPSLEKG